MSKLSYLVKLEITLIALLILMIVLPLVVEYVEEDAAWIISNVLLALIGKNITI